MSDFTPITSRDDLERVVAARLERSQRALVVERAARRRWKAEARKWEQRAKRDAADARRWERLAKQNRVVIAAHESTIQRFVDKLDDVLSEED